MTGPSTFLGIAIVGGLFIAAAALFLFLFKLLFWLVLLPFRLLVWLIALPLLLLKAVALGVAGLLLGLLVVAGGVFVAVAVIVPLLPIVLLVVLTWALVRLLRRPATT
jgi:hypothetical protein